ncbi:MAG: helix-turn-helix transcriptional regulator [Clostridia bacterium]|nr:helix-turn-helix transcriptional regulator [Clostridia bacterium]
MLDKYEKYYLQIGRNVAYYRRLKGLTQAELAKMLQCEISFVGQIEAPNIAKAMSLDMLFKICETLDIFPADLLHLRGWMSTDHKR